MFSNSDLGTPCKSHFFPSLYFCSCFFWWSCPFLALCPQELGVRCILLSMASTLGGIFFPIRRSVGCFFSWPTFLVAVSPRLPSLIKTILFILYFAAIKIQPLLALYRMVVYLEEYKVQGQSPEKISTTMGLNDCRLVVVVAFNILKVLGCKEIHTKVNFFFGPQPWIGLSQALKLD